MSCEKSNESEKWQWTSLLNVSNWIVRVRGSILKGFSMEVITQLMYKSTDLLIACSDWWNQMKIDESIDIDSVVLYNYSWCQPLILLLQLVHGVP